MKFFIDTASVKEIREAASMGILDGVTTNPSLLSKEEGDPTAILKEICTLVDGPVSAEVIALHKDGMVKEAVELSKLHPNIVIKIPLTKPGVQAVRELEEKGIRTNVTLVFSSNQAMLAAKAGASYVSPFIGRLDDSGHVGMDVVREIVAIYGNYGFETEVIVASVRSPLHVIDAALAGAPIVTIPFKVIELMFKHSLTDAGIKRFLEDWEKIKKRS
ncbi:MAG: fructose-6-phosphate aldolase [Candidatus Eiseniibacteriota bacterium]|nr:MAG: fructose-6-phosphate aldolase [Candidatus Eisenbacteria bacterium]